MESWISQRETCCCARSLLDVIFVAKRISRTRPRFPRFMKSRQDHPRDLLTELYLFQRPDRLIVTVRHRDNPADLRLPARQIRYFLTHRAPDHIKMSDEKPKKRDRLLAYFGRAKSRTQIYTGSPSTTTVGSRIRDRKANLPPTSVLSAAGSSGEAIASSVPSGSSPVIQNSTKSLESTVGSPHAAETQDAATESNPTSNVVGTSASAIADNTVTAMDGIATVYYTVTTTDTTSIADDTVTTTDTTVTADGTVTTKTAATADNTKARGPHLWSRAYRGNALSTSERETLAGLAIETDTRDFASSLRNITEGIVDGNRGKHWKIRFKGEEIVMRDVGMKILRWVNRFKEIGDIIVQYDPGHSALPWAGFRFLLKV